MIIMCLELDLVNPCLQKNILFQIWEAYKSRFLKVNKSTLISSISINIHVIFLNLFHMASPSQKPSRFITLHMAGYSTINTKFLFLVLQC